MRNFQLNCHFTFTPIVLVTTPLFLPPATVYINLFLSPLNLSTFPPQHPLSSFHIDLPLPRHTASHPQRHNTPDPSLRIFLQAIHSQKSFLQEIHNRKATVLRNKARNPTLHQFLGSAATLQVDSTTTIASHTPTVPHMKKDRLC